MNMIISIMIIGLSTLTFWGNLPSLIAGDGMQINIEAVVHYVLIDPSGRKTGFDPTANQWYEEIPEANYGSTGVDDHEDLDAPVDYSNELITSRNYPPFDGLYQLKVVGEGFGDYKIGIYFSRKNQAIILNKIGVADSGSVSYYQFNYKSDPDSTIVLERVASSANDLRRDLDLSYKIGWITNQGIYNSLSQKVNNAEKKHQQGQNNAAVNILNAFINELQAQKGKKVTDDAAVILTEDAQYLISLWQ